MRAAYPVQTFWVRLDSPQPTPRRGLWRVCFKSWRGFGTRAQSVPISLSKVLPPMSLPPFCTAQDRPRLKVCGVCQVNAAQKTVYRSRLAPSSPCALCGECFQVRTAQPYC